MTVPKTITEIYAWIVTETDGSEGIPAVIHPFLGSVPLLGADMERVRSHRDQAIAIAKAKNLPLKLCKFSHMEVLEYR